MDRRYLLGFLIAIFVRALTSVHPHSGQSKAPMFGDYEAQRHWMEITVNLPVKEWYRESEKNNLSYWGLDYPPLTAYHSLLCGLAAERINASWVKLNDSRGEESYDNKLFMRSTVLFADLFLFIPALFAYFALKSNVDRRNQVFAYFTCAALYPGLILIDHGHFQYNCVSLGFTLLAIIGIEKGFDAVASFMFCLALNYKQMSLYHALPFFFYLLGKHFVLNLRSSFFTGVSKILQIGLVVVLTFSIIWYPLVHFGHGIESIFDVLHRLFPLQRGIYEDKVANFWCSANVLVKLNRFAQDKMVIVAALTTFISSLPSGIDLLRNPTVVKFKYSLLISSLSFYLFSYQVHEKSILLAALPAMLLLRLDPIPILWFLLTTIASMIPLLIKDGLIIPTLALSCIYIIVGEWICHGQLESWVIEMLERKVSDKVNFLRKQVQLAQRISYCFLFGLSSLCVVGRPPKRYPDLYTVLLSLLCAGHFCCFWLYFLYCQISIGREKRKEEMVKKFQ